MSQASRDRAAAYEIRYEPLAGRRRPRLAFPCDEQGHVQLDALGDRALNDYLFARAVVGLDYAAPAVRCCELH